MSGGLTWDAAFFAGFPLLQLDPAQIEAMITANGSCAEYRKGQICPCVRVETHAANAACTVCSGVGMVYPAELRSRIRILDHSRTTSYRQQAAGLLLEGQLSVWVPSSITPAKGDVILPDGDEQVFQEIFHRDLLQVTNRMLSDRLLVPDQSPRRLRARPSRLLHTDAIIESIYWIRGIGENAELLLAREGTDYTFREGLIEWLPGDSPGEAQGFTVRYRANSAYEVFRDPPMVRRFAGRVMPRSVSAQRLDKVQRKADLR